MLVDHDAVAGNDDLNRAVVLDLNAGERPPCGGLGACEDRIRPQASNTFSNVLGYSCNCAAQSTPPMPAAPEVVHVLCRINACASLYAPMSGAERT